MVQAILATLGEADDPDEVDYFTLNKEQPLHLNINVDPDQVGLDNEEFQDKEDDEAVQPKENITLGLLICFSYATSQTRLFQPLSSRRSFGNA